MVFNYLSVGGGAIFSSATPVAGSVQALAAGLVPAGLTPVAFFAANPAVQQIPALSVIFLEATVGKRKKRNVNDRYVEAYQNYYEDVPETIFGYYKRNLIRFTGMVKRGEIEELLRPGKFSTEPPNNLELILRYKNAHFEGMINSTKNR